MISTYRTYYLFIQTTLVLFFISCFSISAIAQFEDNFNLGELDAAWNGDRHAFVLEDQELQLDTMDSGTAVLYRTETYPDSFQLEGYFSLDFPPSSSNKFSLYFMTDTIDNDFASGYYFSVGESGSDDALEIYRLDNGTESLLWRGENGSLADDPQCRFSIERDVSGNWTVSLAFSKDAAPILRGQFSDDTYTPDEDLLFYMQCDYTSTRSSAFSIDDVAIKEIVPDTIPPSLTGYEFPTGTEVNLLFSEKLSPVSLNSSNFSIENSQINEVNYGSDSTQLSVSFTDPLPIEIENKMTISGITDQEGNTAADTSILLQYFAERAPMKGELIITEILPDPSENGFLPDYEFIEVYNNSEDYLQLESIIYADESSDEPLNEYVLQPGEYLIICESEAKQSYEEYGNVMALSSFPSLNNSGDVIQLRLNGEVLDELSYSDATYGNSDLRQNGYSLELQETYDPCAPEIERWAASNAEFKASPGEENSLWETSGEARPIHYEYYSMPADQVIELKFDKEITTDLSEVQISIEPEIAISSSFAEKQTLTLSIESPLAENTDYSLLISELQDCAGNVSADFDIPINAVAEASKGDLIFNEILYDPPSGTEQYIELKNCSENAINLSELTLIYYEDTIKNTFSIPNNRILPSQDIIVLSEEPADISDTYELRYPSRLLKVENIPSLDRESGRLSMKQIQMRRTETLDSMIYSDEFHTSFLNTTKGVSLERLGCKTDGVKSAVWNSAAQSENYGTPTYENSQKRELPTEDTTDLFNLVSPTFSPDGDGFEDNLLIQYTGDKVAQRIRFEIYDLQGRQVTTLLNNASVAVDEILNWDGSTSDQTVALPGIYILYADVYDDNGNKKSWKSSCVLAR